MCVRMYVCMYFSALNHLSAVLWRNVKSGLFDYRYYVIACQPKREKEMADAGKERGRQTAWNTQWRIQGRG